ncbi:hypothetical protein AB0333_01365 [Citricoccus sp. NPDC079358]|uniref:hypothetical protein n=1 Tax=Citricoccus sp. NPDC079358 TaxID=3154653 RepID=UPI0034500D65
MVKGRDSVSRPNKKSEHIIRFGTREAEKGWQDLLATQRNALVDAWDFLTRTPLERSPTNYPLRDDLGIVVRHGTTFEQWQHKMSGGARLWFYVDDRTVVLVQCHTRHPNETKT